MNYFEYSLTNKKEETEDTYIYQLKPKKKEDTFTFLPGQYVLVKNAKYKPNEEHPFSIASSPTDLTSLEFCIKTYGDWTEEMTKAEIGDTFHVSEPQGNFTWESDTLHAVFLLGGIGISPIMSMLRFMRDMKLDPDSLIMLYGNRTPESVAYRKELEELQKSLHTLKIVDIYSHIPDEFPWNGYRGFITKDILEKEVNLTLQPTFFTIGPPVFIEKMDELLDAFSIPSEKRMKEDLSTISITSIEK